MLFFKTHRHIAHIVFPELLDALKRQCGLCVYVFQKNINKILCLANKAHYWLFIIVSFLCVSCQGDKKPKITSEKYAPPISIKGLQKRIYNAKLNFEKKLEGAEKWDADLWSYYSDSLKIYALINTPKTVAPESGFPILIFGHGFHPEPKKYGVSNSTGKNWRPGDYYRGVPEGYTEKGFLTITPDYRGHNISEGFEFTQTSFLASTYYAIDVLHLIAALPDLKNVDLNNIYYMGHSMGGDVGLKMLFATNKVKAASLWAGVSGTTWEQALYYGKYYDENGGVTDREKMKKYMTRLDSVINELSFEYNIDEGDPINYIAELNMPLIIHHGKWEQSVPYIWSESLVAALFKYNKQFEFYAYDTKNHLFKNENRKKAVERDIAFFEKIKSKNMN